MRPLLLAAVLLIAGCVGRDDAPLETAAIQPTSGTAPSVATEPTFEEAAVGAPTLPVESTATFSWDGRTAGAFCVADVRCQIVSEPDRTWTPLESLGAAGPFVRVRGTITWTPETPLTEELRMFVFGLDGEGGIPLEGVETSGPSPLDFEVDLASLDGIAYALSLHGHHEAGSVIVETPQAFHVDLEVTTRA